MSSCIQHYIHFTMKTICISSLVLQILIILAYFATSNAVESDISCLRSIKESLQDPQNLLNSWDFSNLTEGFICRFAGVECWHIDESKVLNIKLYDLGLRGPFPVGLKNCTSITGLDLSSNQLTGPIPSNLADILPFIISLDLSFNKFSGPMPDSIVNCRLINVLKLDHNQLTGQIPQNLSRLDRIKEFNVAHNKLWGQVPLFRNASVPPKNYSGNSGLCGKPLRICNNEGHEDLFFSGFEVGFPLSTILTMSLIFCCFPRLPISDMRAYRYLIKKIKGGKHHLVTRSPEIPITEESSSEESKVTAMEKFICRLTLVELEMSTNNFDIKKVIGYGNMGIMYKASFPNGLLLAVKRLHKFESFDKEFLLEIEILGRLRHTNILSLLSFCFEKEKKFLIYKYMCNGTLHQWLHSRPQVEGKKMGWTLRFKIAIGIARGLVWLHHNNVLRVAHLKISSKCILLDDMFEPKISNFANSNILMNTSGIPSSCCNFWVPDSSPSPYKEDVYRFGILLFELVGGKEAFTWINSISGGWDVNVVIDECLKGQGFDEEIYETIVLAKTCIRAQKDRATSMLQVYQAMRAIAVSRNEFQVDSCIDVEDNERDM